MPEDTCPACGATVDVYAVLDGKECPECLTHRRVIYALADGVVDRDECEEQYDGGPLVIPAERRAAIRKAREEMDDPAEPDTEAVYV